jgi:hypothetical protein
MILTSVVLPENMGSLQEQTSKARQLSRTVPDLPTANRLLELAAELDAHIREYERLAGMLRETVARAKQHSAQLEEMVKIVAKTQQWLAGD